MKAPRIPEKAVQAHVVQLLRSIGGKVWVTGTKRPRGDFQGTRMTPGLPDLVAFLPPRAYRIQGDIPYAKPVLLFVECKAAGGRLRPEQQEFRDLCQDCDVAHIAGDLDAVIAWLSERHYVRASQFPTYRQPKSLEVNP
jgi:hypothetical protein